MNTASLKNFAIRSRNILKSGVLERLLRLGFDGKGNLIVAAPQPFQGGCKFMDQIMEGDFYDSWMQLQSRITTYGVQEVCEEAAYTWFNRLVAIRILQKNGFIEPVMQYVDPESRIPVILTQARAGRLNLKMNGADSEELSRLLVDPAATKEQFAILIKAFCEVNPVIYNCFGGIEKYISLLLPDNILDKSGFIDLLNTADFISDDDYRHSELIGWLYQFYISEKKDEVFAAKTKIARDDIPAATQIFTPNWIVRYMVQNTLGRTYLDNNPDSPLREKMEYLVESAVENPLRLDDLADYKFIDPACGSGHILGEGFNLLYEMYMEEFYSPRMAIENIFLHNLIGIDIDTRARQLAAFSLLMKAAQKDNSFLDGSVMPRVLDMPELFEPEGGDLRDFIPHYLLGGTPEAVKEIFEALLLMRKARNLGSIMKFSLSDATRYALAKMTREWKSQPFAPPAITAAIPSMELILALTDRYTAVVANPPYMGRGHMNVELAKYLDNNYKIASQDLFASFMSKMLGLTTDGGRCAFITMESWMFLSSFEKFRRQILEEYYISSLGHFGWHIIGIAFGTAMTVIEKNKANGRKGEYSYLTIDDIDRTINRPFIFPKKDNGRYAITNQKDFEKIPGSPIGYWVSERMLDVFTRNLVLSAVCKPTQGLATADNTRFLREWFEVDLSKIGFGLKDSSSAAVSGKKWFPYNKGGSARKWYGNQEFIVNWENDGDEIRHIKGTNGRIASRPQNTGFYFKESLSWSKIASGNIAFRFFSSGFIFDVAGTSLFNKGKVNNVYVLGCLNSKVTQLILSVLSPTLNYEVGQVGMIPIAINENSDIERLVQQNIAISKQDWDAHETSWDFRENELVRLQKEDFQLGNASLEDVMIRYKFFWESQFRRLHDNEEQLNREFISIYGLQDELTPDVPLDEVTILQQGEISIVDGQFQWNDAVLMRQLLSYAIGCSMGRWRLDRPGLHIAHPDPTIGELAPYDAFGQSFTIDDDGIIPLMSHDTPFEDDNAFRRVVNYVTQAFGEKYLTENLNFIERSLGKSIEDYFIKDFWKDHCKLYQNRPIYWLFTSRKGNFQVAVYMHRMNKYTAERIRTRYLLPYIDFLSSRIVTERERGAELTSSERKALSRMEAALEDCREYHERLHSIAEKQIEFDLDDGVAVNYAKFGDVLAKLK